jgi:hypothetical protein
VTEQQKSSLNTTEEPSNGKFVTFDHAHHAITKIVWQQDVANRVAQMMNKN